MPPLTPTIMAKFTKQDIQGEKTHIPSFEGY